MELGVRVLLDGFEVTNRLEAVQVPAGGRDQEAGVLALRVSISWVGALWEGRVKRARATEAGHLGLCAKDHPRGHPSSTWVVEPGRGRTGARAQALL